MAGTNQVGKRGFVATIRATEHVTVRITYEQYRHLTRKYGSMSAGIRALIDRDMQPPSVQTDAEEWDT